MAKRLAIPSEHTKVRIVGPYDSFDVSRAQRITLGTELPTTDIYELGNNQLAGTAQDTPNVTLSFSVFDVGIKTFSVLTGTNPAAYPAEGVDISELGECDAIVYIRDADLNNYVKSAHAKRLQIRDFTFTYSVDGESTEDYTVIGSERRFFKNNVVVDRFTSGTTSFNLTGTPVTLKNGNELLTVILDGEYLVEVADTPGEGEYSVSGTTLTTGDERTAQVIAIYQAALAGDEWSYISDASMPAAIRGRDVGISIGVNSITRVQSVTINGNLNVQQVREMGNRNVVGYQRQVPTVEGTIAVLDTDSELIALLISGDIDSPDTEFEFGMACPSGTLSLDIELRDPCDGTVPYDVVKTVRIPQIVPVGDSWTSTVNQNAMWNINFKSETAQCIVYSGSI